VHAVRTRGRCLTASGTRPQERLGRWSARSSMCRSAAGAVVGCRCQARRRAALASHALTVSPRPCSHRLLRMHNASQGIPAVQERPAVWDTVLWWPQRQAALEQPCLKYRIPRATAHARRGRQGGSWRTGRV